MQFRDLNAQYRLYKVQIDEAIQTVLNAANFISGKEVSILETALAEFVGVKYCITCANGTEAMTLLLMAWDIQPGDAVFVPDFTFFSTGEVVSFRGATPIFVDVDRSTFNMDPKSLELAIEKTLKAGKLKPRMVIPVDLFGLPANFPEIESIAKKYNLLVLEDCAQGFGGKIGEQMAGSFGHASTTSFFPAKPLGCYGDGGAIFTNDESLATMLKSYKVHGQGMDKYDNVRVGLNSRLDTIQAAILQVKLEALEAHELEDVNRVYHSYTTQLKSVVETPTIPEGYYSSFAQYTIKLKNKAERDGLQAYLKSVDIPSMVYYVKPMHRQGAFKSYSHDETTFPVTNTLVEVVLSLPMHPYLTEEEIQQVCDHIKIYLTQ